MRLRMENDRWVSYANVPKKAFEGSCWSRWKKILKTKEKNSNKK
jgi:hypothetical protein